MRGIPLQTAVAAVHQSSPMSITILETHFDAVKVVRPARHDDARGYFCETYNADAFAGCGIDCRFVQDNHSYSRGAGTIRGMHFQLPPYAQAKLVRVLRGSILDVAVDVRKGSPTFGRHAAVQLSADNGIAIFIPVGFAHGFCTLEPDTEVLYKVDAYYSRQHERGLRWNDPSLGIEWPTERPTLSEKDGALPLLSQLKDLLQYSAA